MRKWSDDPSSTSIDEYYLTVVDLESGEHEIIPNAKHLALVENTPAFTDAVKRLGLEATDLGRGARSRCGHPPRARDGAPGR